MIETLKEIGLVVFMQVLSLILEFIDTGTLKPSVRKRVAVELIVLSVYVAGMTVFKGMISDELITLIGTVYLAVVVSHLYKFLTEKKEEIMGEDKEE
uniref:Putative holin n=2 Tax=Ceduovirus c2 TaxID=31537 RepID=Q53CH7_9CAUD|nr:putative holin [Lactococcus phage 923]AAT81370.1 putative holin [Lactococcus phage Rc6]AAT81374.1 putative holin [Lactococcus phage Rc6]